MISGLAPKVSSATNCREFSGYAATEQESELLQIEKYYRLNRAETPNKSKRKKKLRIQIPTT